MALFAFEWGLDPRETQAPTRILYGTADVITPPSNATDWHEMIPHAKVTAIPDGGHWLHDYEPAVYDEILTLGKNMD